MEYFVYNFEKFVLVFSRVIGIVMTATFFSSKTVQNHAKFGFTFFVTILIFPLVYPYIPEISGGMVGFGLLATGEAIIGIALGMSISIAFSVFQVAGQFFTVQMGFGASEVFDPMSQLSLPIMGQFLYLVFIMIFMSINGPAFILKELFHSFELVNFTRFINSSFITSDYGLIFLFGNIFIIGLRIAIPIIGTLLLVSMSMGLFAKAAPQMNLLLIGFPISITVGFLTIIALMPLIINFTVDYVKDVFENMWLLMLEMYNG